MELEDSLIMGNEELSTNPEKESDEFIKTSVEDLITIPRESEDTFGSDSESVLPSSDDFSPIFKEKSMTFSNPLFDSNDFTSSDNELLSDEDVPPEDFNLHQYPLSNLNDDRSLINIIREGDIIYLESLLIDDTSPILPLEVFLDHNPRRLKDEPDNDDLMIEDKVFDPEIYKKSFSLTLVKLTFEDSSFLLSFGSEDTIFDPNISTFHFSLKPMAYENPMVIFPFFCFCPKDKGIRGESS
ncbi:hypothetical protein Tco_0822971 [Tanacetum coccineum]|uniref:Reverse transcriptase domain-containing protein n=1 Tax=Tanacetum coccineum TaxID=301880 RepID=A0ABQ5AJ65_9ASTR